MDNKSLFYEAPSAKVFLVEQQRVICASEVSSGSMLGGWTESGGGSGSNDLGGWTDNGDSAWN